MHGHRLLAVLRAPAQGARGVAQGCTPGAACFSSEGHASLPRQFMYSGLGGAGSLKLEGAALG